MSHSAKKLPNDPAELKAMIAALQAENAQIAAENAKMSATLRAHDQLVQALRLRIAKLQKLAFGKSSEKVEREIEQLELALEDLLVAVAEKDEVLSTKGWTSQLQRRRQLLFGAAARVCLMRPCGNAVSLTQVRVVQTVGAICASRQRRAISCAPMVRRARMSANCST